MSDHSSQVTFQAPEIDQLAPLFPGYEIEHLIASGGMGAVYRAVQKSLDRTVAIKILPHEFSSDAAFCAGFEAEAKAMARLNHPNLIGVYDFGEVDGMLYIVMEYVPGNSIYHSADGTAIDPGEVIRLVTGICNGLAHAHEHGIIHRDIKPSNILLDPHAEPKIGDFGLARPIDHQVQEGDEIFGTPHYTAPEVVETPHAVDHRADIFSVGVMLHELLTGQLPANDPRPASSIIHCDPRFDAIIRRATNPRPDARYSSAAEIAHDLHEIATSAGPRVLQTSAARRPLTKRARAASHPTKTSSNSGVVILLLILGIGAALFALVSKMKTNREVETQQTSVPEETRPDQVKKPEPPAPKPKPGPELAPKPATEPKAVVQSKPAEVTAPPAALPKFDVTGFFKRAQTIMQERAAPMIAKRDRALADNLSIFEGRIQRTIRGISSLSQRNAAGEIATELFDEIKSDGNRIPDDIDEDLADIGGIANTHQEFLKRQAAIDDSLHQELTQLSKVYILGLEKQIERLQDQDDPAAIELIKEEIETTRSDDEHFPDLMLGEESSDAGWDDE